jgi:hypothetical protein
MCSERTAGKDYYDRGAIAGRRQVDSAQQQSRACAEAKRLQLPFSRGAELKLDTSAAIHGKA